MTGRVRVYSAVSLDGFLAGEDDDLSWLGQPEEDPAKDPGVLDFAGFLGQVGAMLMGQRTYEVVRGFGAWPYGDLPVLVATHRLLDDDPPSTVRAASGDIGALCDQALEAASGRDVYLDGGGLVSQALDAGRVDELILTLVPVLLGRGVPVYQGAQRHHLQLTHHGRYGAMLQVFLGRG